MSTARLRPFDEGTLRHRLQNFFGNRPRNLSSNPEVAQEQKERAIEILIWDCIHVAGCEKLLNESEFSWKAKPPPDAMEQANHESKKSHTELEQYCGELRPENWKAAKAFIEPLLKTAEGGASPQKLYLNGYYVKDRFCYVAKHEHRSENCSPLCLAANRGYLGLTQLLLEHGADPVASEQANVEGILRRVINDLRYDIIDALIKAFKDPKKDINTADQFGVTCLHIVCRMEQDHPREAINVLKLLLEHGADVNCVDIAGQTPLFWCRGIESAELLLKHGADPKIASHRRNETALYHHIAGRRSRIAEKILTTCIEIQRDPGLRTVAAGEKAPVLYLDVPTKSGATALHAAFSFDDIALGKRLWEAGANMRLVDEENRVSPLVILASKAYPREEPTSDAQLDTMRDARALFEAYMKKEYHDSIWLPLGRTAGRKNYHLQQKNPDSHYLVMSSLAESILIHAPGAWDSIFRDYLYPDQVVSFDPQSKKHLKTCSVNMARQNETFYNQLCDRTKDFGGREAILSLLSCNNPSVLSNEYVIALVDAFWLHYCRTVVIVQMVFLLLLLAFTTVMFTSKRESIWATYLVLILSTVHGCGQLFQLFRLGTRYFQPPPWIDSLLERIACSEKIDKMKRYGPVILRRPCRALQHLWPPKFPIYMLRGWNYLDLIAYILLALSSLFRVIHGVQADPIPPPLLALLLIYLWLKFVQFGGAFKRTSIPIRLVSTMASRLIYYIVIIVIFVGASASVFYGLVRHLNVVYPDHTGFSDYITTVYTLLRTLLSDPGYEAITTSTNPFAISAFVVFGVVGTILLLNFLTSVMTNTFESARQESHSNYRVDRASTVGRVLQQTTTLTNGYSYYFVMFFFFKLNWTEVIKRCLFPPPADSQITTRMDILQGLPWRYGRLQVPKFEVIPETPPPSRILYRVDQLSTQLSRFTQTDFPRKTDLAVAEILRRPNTDVPNPESLPRPDPAQLGTMLLSAIPTSARPAATLAPAPPALPFPQPASASSSSSASFSAASSTSSSQPSVFSLSSSGQGPIVGTPLG